MDMRTNGIDKQFWGDRLEVNVDLLSQRHADPTYMAGWVARLKKRPRSLLAAHLDLDDELGVRDMRSELLDRAEQLLPVMLVEAATAGKRAYAIVEVARTRLGEDDLASCRMPNESYDRLALMWLLYQADPRNLELVAFLDRVQRKGFARMVLDAPPRENGHSARSFFTRSTIQAVLDEHERAARTRRRSVCAEILHDGGGNYQVFIKRDLKSSFVSHGERNTFGFEPEWMVLEFEPDLHRVHLSSVSPHIPAVFANKIASRFFGVDVTYENESLYTPMSAVRAFLDALIEDPEELPLVEVSVRSCALRNGPQLRLNDPENRSLAPAIQHFGGAFRGLLDNVEDIASLKVLRFDKRVKVVFELADEDEDELIVRYSDQPLTGTERRKFERLMLEDFGITVLSTEKRYAR